MLGGHAVGDGVIPVVHGAAFERVGGLVLPVGKLIRFHEVHHMEAVFALDDARVAALTAGIEAPILKGLDIRALAHIAHKTAVGGGAAVGGLGGGESGKLILGFVAGVVELRVNVGGGLLVRDQNVADSDGVIVVAAAGVEENGDITAALLGDRGIALRAVGGKRPGEHIISSL